jgi:alpha,alpha-trehalase
MRIGNDASPHATSSRDTRAPGPSSSATAPSTNARTTRRLWPIVETQAECGMKVWREPDQGICEARGKPQQYVSSKLMRWVALDRAAKLAEIRGDATQQQTWRAAADEIRSDILEHGVSDRGALRQHYETDDRLSGKEGTFLICSFWLVSALSIIGEKIRARDLMERLLRIAFSLGLYAEEFKTDCARHLGNFPQAFSHLALIEAAARITVSERLEEVT